MGKLQPPDIHRVLEFQQLLLTFQSIKRVVHLPGTLAEENDVEHSYGLAMMGWFLSQSFPELNRDKIIRYGLVHDMVEIHAGDTFAYADQALLDSKHEREAAALEKLKVEWSDFPDMLDAISHYEARDDEEAKFVYALDKILPPIIIYLNEGHTWKKEGITLEMLHQIKKDKVSISPDIEKYYDQLSDLLKARPDYFGTKSDI